MDPTTFSQRYGQIEEAYRQQEWPSVMEQCQTLLGDLEKNPQEGTALKTRLQLLMAHTLLYGFSDLMMAEDLYTKVAADSSESSIQPLAEEGIRNCRAMRAQRREKEARDQAEEALRRKNEQEAQSRAQAGTNGSGPTTASQSPNQSPVMPWLTRGDDSGLAAAAAQAMSVANLALVNPILTPVGETLIPEIVEEPELMELHQAESSLAEEVDLMVRDRLGVGLNELGDRNRHSIEAVALAEQAEKEEEATQVPVQPEDEDLMAGLLRVVLS